MEKWIQRPQETFRKELKAVPLRCSPWRPSADHTHEALRLILPFSDSKFQKLSQEKQYKDRSSEKFWSWEGFSEFSQIKAKWVGSWYSALTSRWVPAAPERHWARLLFSRGQFWERDLSESCKPPTLPASGGRCALVPKEVSHYVIHTYSQGALGTIWGRRAEKAGADRGTPKK